MFSLLCSRSLFTDTSVMCLRYLRSHVTLLGHVCCAFLFQEGYHFVSGRPATRKIRVAAFVRSVLTCFVAACMAVSKSKFVPSSMLSMFENVSKICMSTYKSVRSAVAVLYSAAIVYEIMGVWVHFVASCAGSVDVAPSPGSTVHEIG